MDIKIKDAILHILDSSSGLAVYSQEALELEDEKIQDFLARHIERIFNDQGVRTGRFLDNSRVKTLIEKKDESFIETSLSIAGLLYEKMARYVEIPSGDLVLASLEIENQDFLIIIKFNYREGYTHYVDYGDKGTANKIVINKTMFPSEAQRNIEAALINLEDLSLRIFEKECEIEGKKISYFSQLFLECDSSLSIKESIKIIRDVAKDLTRDYYDEDFEKVSQIKEAIYEDFDRGSIEVENVANAMFRNNPDIKREYMERLEEAGVDKSIDLEGKRPEKRLTVHKIKTDSGIQVDIPVDLYRDKNIIEFINNPDGTISIIIKNISQMKQGN